MKTHVITILATKSEPKPLTLTDDEGHSSHSHAGDQKFTTDVEPGDIVKWCISKDAVCAISEINNIKAKPMSENLFSVGPHALDNGDWQGKIGDFSEDSTEAYTIWYTVDDERYFEDPKIKVHL